MFTQVIVPIDSTRDSLRALFPARVIANVTGAQLLATSVVDDARNRIGRAQHLSEKIRKLGIDVDVVVTYANSQSVNEGLAHLVASSESPLIVLATKGHSHLAKVYGSVAEELLHAWPNVPTLLVGPEVDVASFELDGPIIACVDLTTESEAVMAPVARLSQEFNLAPWVLTVVEPASVSVGTGSAWVPDKAVVSENFIESNGVHAVANRLQRMGTAQVNWEVLHGKDPAISIADFADGLNASIVAVASRDRGGLSRLLMGSVAMETVSRAPCPVLAVHADGPSLAGPE